MSSQQTNGNTTIARRQQTAPAARPQGGAEQVWSGELSLAQQAAVRKIAERYQLDPFLGHVIVLGGKLYIGVEGWLEIANRHAQYDGFELRPLTRHEKDAMLAGDDDVMFEAKVWRKDRRFPGVAFGRANRLTVAAELRLQGQARGQGEKLVIEVAQARAVRKALRASFRATELPLPAPGEGVDEETEAAPTRDYGPFWQAVRELGVSNERAHEILGVDSLTEVPDLRAAYVRIKAAVQAHRVEQARGPMTREGFLALAYDLGARDKHHVAELLNVKHLDDWARQGRSWEDAHAYVAGRLTQPEPGAQGVVDGEAVEAEPPVAAEAPLHLDDAPF